MIYLTFNYQRKQKLEQLDIFDYIYNNKQFKYQIGPDYSEFCTIKIDKINKTPKTDYYIQTLKRLKNYYTEDVMELLNEGLDKHYTTYPIPKRSGGYRTIDAPDNKLKTVLKHITNFLQYDCEIKTHNAAYAYVPKRCAKNSLERHRHNESKHFLHLDLKDFFGSCTEDFIHNQLKQIFPFSELYKDEESVEIVQTLVKLALYKKRLPQGSPLSPLLTNIIMIPIDYALYEALKQHNKQHFVYTRYADDIDISSKYDFDYKEILKLIEKTFQNTPLKINYQKVHYTTTAHQNWHLGLMLNQHNQITLGYKKKKEIKTNLYTYCKTKETWSKSDAETFLGELNYFIQIEPEYAQYLIDLYSKKYNNNIDILTELKTIK